MVFGDVDYGDPNNPNVIIEVINDEHIQVTIDDGSLLIENLYKFLEEGEDAGLVFADSGQPFGTGPQALLVPSFDSLDAFTATAAGGPGADGGGDQTGTSGRGNDGRINPPDLNVDHIHAPTIEGVIPRPDFDFESDIVPEDPEPEVESNPVIVSISDATPVQEPVLSDGEGGEGGGGGEQFTMTFDGGEGSLSGETYIEGGLTVMSEYASGTGHLHQQFSGGTPPALFIHNSCCSAPYEFTATEGGAFSMLSFEVISSSGFTVFAIKDGVAIDSIVVPSGFTGLLELPAYFQGVDAVRLGTDNAQQATGVIDNVVYTLGGAGGGDFVMAEFTVFLETGATDADVTVTVSAQDGRDPTATGGSDYDDAQFFADEAGTIPLAGNMVTIPADDTSVVVYVKVFGDDIAEFTEFFELVISDPINAQTGDPVGEGSILDNAPPVEFSIDDQTVTEGDPLGPDATITFTVTKTGDSVSTTSVNYTVFEGSALDPQDYNNAIDALSGTVTFLAGETSKTITLDVTDDLVAEQTETFTVVLSGASGGTISDDTGLGTILDNDPLPAFSINDQTVTEGDPEGTDATITFTVTKSGDSDAASTVDYTVVEGSATDPEDYNNSLDALSGTLTFQPGEFSKTITLDVTDDLIAELTETFTVVLNNETNASISDDTGLGTILDNDPLPAMSINDQTVTEGDPGGDDATITFTITKTGDSDAFSSVFYTVVEGSATDPEDYNNSGDALSGTVTFLAGEFSKTITLDVTDDFINETTETFTVVLSSPINATISDGSGLGTILDNDAPTTPTENIAVDDEGLNGGVSGGVGDVTLPVQEHIVSGSFDADFGEITGTINLSLMDGQSDTLGTESINFAWAGNILTATVSGGARDSQAIFTLEVTDPATGAYTFTLLLPVVHAAGLDENNTAVALTYSAVDSDGTTTNGTVNIDVDDDSPGALEPEDTVIQNEIDETPNADDVVIGDLNFVPGADGIGGAVFEGGADGDLSLSKDGISLMSDNAQIYLYGFGTDTLIGSTSLPVDVGDPTNPGNEVFTVVLNAAGDDYTFTLIAGIDNADGAGFGYLSGVGTAGNVPFKFIENDELNQELELLITPKGLAATVNSDSDDIATDNQWIATDEGIRIDVGNFTLLELNGDPWDGTGKAPDFDVENHTEITNFTFGIVQTKGQGQATVSVEIFDDTDDDVATEEGKIALTLASIVVLDENSVVLFESSIKTAAGLIEAGFDVHLDTGTIYITGMDPDWTVQVTSATVFDAIQILDARLATPNGEPVLGGDDFALGHLEIMGDGSTEERTLNFEIEATDGDGDSIGGDFDVVLAPNSGISQIGGDGVDNLLGTAGTDNLYGLGGNDTLSGLAGDDLLDGGIGLDTMTGGDGNDIFRLVDEDVGVNVDVITDFTTGDYSVDGNNDALDISDLLSSNGISTGGITLSLYLRVEADGDVRFDAGGDVKDTSTVVATTNALTAGQTVSVFIDTNLDPDAGSLDTSLTVFA